MHITDPIQHFFLVHFAVQCEVVLVYFLEDRVFGKTSFPLVFLGFDLFDIFGKGVIHCDQMTSDINRDGHSVCIGLYLHAF